MRLEDAALDRLRVAVRAPDLSGTPYRLVGPIGTGGMGAVFEVEDERLGRHVALKIVDVPLDGEGPAEALLHEARVLAGLEHPGLVPVHDAGRLADGRAFYVMKLVQGEPLDAHLAPKEGEATAPLAMGTPGFMAPEQASGGDVDARADVFGLGAVLDAALRVPPASPRSKALAAILARATAEDRNSRYPDVGSLAADVARLLDGERVEAHAEGPAERAVRLLRRHRVAVGLVLAYLAVRGLFIFFRS